LTQVSTAQKALHSITVKHLRRYLLGTQDKGFVLKSKLPMELTSYVNADFCGTWNKKHTENDPDMACLHRRFVVFDADSLVYWQSKLQTMIAQLTVDNELNALPKATRFIKLLSYLVHELQKKRLMPMEIPHIF
jgi:hypothetical protein